MSKSKLYGVFTVLMIAMLTLSACGGAAAKKLEIFSWWTGGGEAAGLDAMIVVFNAKNPNIEFINAAVAGGAGTNARAVLATRLQAGDPPDSWQGHAGQELIGTYVAGNQIQPLNDLYASEGWLAVMPQTLIPLISDGGNIYSVPVNIHRANVMWYNPAVLSANGVSVPTTMDEWFAAMDTLQAAGVTPLALGEQWTKLHLLETVLLGTLGPDKYNGLWTGATDWGSAEVTKSLENFQKILTYTNSDSASLSWQDAAQLVVNGNAAFNVMGDWAEGYFRELGKAPMADYGWAPVPGGVGVFQFLSDSFVLAVGAPEPDLDRCAAMAHAEVGRIGGRRRRCRQRRPLHRRGVSEAADAERRRRPRVAPFEVQGQHRRAALDAHVQPVVDVSGGRCGGRRHAGLRQQAQRDGRLGRPATVQGVGSGIGVDQAHRDLGRRGRERDQRRTQQRQGRQRPHVASLRRLILNISSCR